MTVDINPPRLDVLIPTYERPNALAVTLTSLLGQTFTDFRVIVSDQSDDAAIETPIVQALARILAAAGRGPRLLRHRPRRGLAEQRAFLFEQATAPYVLFLDDDVVLAARTIEVMTRVIEAQACGFVGSAVIGLSYLDDVRPDEQSIEFWDGRVQPEAITPEGPGWDRWRLHNAANLWHIQQRLGITEGAPRAYRVAWTGGCVLYDAAALRAVGGFGFWRDLPPEHVGEDVLAQLRVMERFGGCGVLPSGAFHLELPTTLPTRTADAPRLLPLVVPNELPAAS